MQEIDGLIVKISIERKKLYFNKNNFHQVKRSEEKYISRALDCGSRGWGFETPRSPIPSSSFSMD